MYMVVAMIYSLCYAYFMYNYMSSPFLCVCLTMIV